MTNKKTDKLTSWILNLKPTKTVLIFGLLLPLYTIWLRYIGLFTINKNGRNKNLFNIFSAILIVAVFAVFIISFYLQIERQKISETLNLLIPLTFLTILFVCNGITAKNMVDFENRNNEYFYGLTKIKEYIFRFFHLFYFPFSIYWLQMNVNRYLDSNVNDK